MPAEGDNSKNSDSLQRNGREFFMRMVIFANGELHHPEQARSLAQAGDYLIAADGGLRHMLALGLTPNLVIGDMDSLEAREMAEIASASVEVIRHPQEKDQTDLELAVIEAAERGGNPIVITAALGGRLDMTIANLMVLARSDLATVQISIVDGPQEVCIIRKNRQIDGNVGDSVSLLAVSGPARSIRTEGLRYPLRDEMLHPEETRGISNVMLAKQANIWVEHGLLLCIHTRHSENKIQKE